MYNINEVYGHYKNGSYGSYGVLPLPFDNDQRPHCPKVVEKLIEKCYDTTDWQTLFGLYAMLRCLGVQPSKDMYDVTIDIPFMEEGFNLYMATDITVGEYIDKQGSQSEVYMWLIEKLHNKEFNLLDVSGEPVLLLTQDAEIKTMNKALTNLYRNKLL